MSTSAEQAVPASRSRPATLGTVAAVVSLVAAVVFPFAPVAREEVTYSWRGDTPAAQATAIPMLPYQPVSTTATISCAAAAGLRGAVLSTTPPVTDPAAEPLGGLLVTSDGAPAPTVTVTSAATTLRPVRLPAPSPAGPCGLTLTSTHDATELVLTTGTGPPAVVDRVASDVRPAVAGAFTPRPAPPGGLTLAAVGDTRFQTSISAAKIAVGAVAVLAALVVLVVLARLDRRRRGPPPTTRPFRRTHASRGRLGYLVDAAVVAGLAIWQVVGPLGVDDGYIAGIVRSRFADGQVGTVFRWLNSPETPFGWFYDVLAGIAAADPAPFWLRLPSTVLGVVAWWLLTRAVLPRLRLPAGRWSTVVAGVVFLAWWLPFDLGVRPEPWVVVGWAVVLVALERALARRALLPAAVALLVAGFTLAVTPTGLVAFTPFLAAAVPLARLVRARRADAGLPLLALGAAAALGVTLLLVYNDQTWASALDSVDIRRLIGGDRPWSDEYVRYASLLTVGDVEGSLGRRAPVLLLLLALAALALPVVRDGLRGIARGPARRMITGTVASLVVLALTPTKWTHHFGAFAIVGTAVTLIALHAWLTAPARDRDADRATPRRATIALAVTAGVAGLVLSGYNQWPWVSSYALAWTDAAPTVAGVRLADLVLLLGVVASLAAAAVALRRRLASGHVSGSGGYGTQNQTHGRRPLDRRLVLASPVLVLAVVALVVAAEVLTTARTAVERRDSYTLASDSLASLTGRSCGLADQLRVERDPRAGLLPAAPVPAGGDGAGTPPGAVTTLRAAGLGLPGWTGPGVAGGWSALPARPTRAADDAPLVLTVAGPVLTPGRLALEVADPATGTVTRMPLDEDSSQYSTSASVAAPGARDLRVDRGELPDRGAVRVVTAADAPADQAVSAPRVPRTVPWLQVVPPGAAAAVDWPAAFLFPCTPIAALRDGLAALPAWRISVDARTEQASGYISYTASQGGPWAATRTLVRQERLPVYLPGAPMTDVASLERWVPVVTLGPGPRVDRRRVTEWGTASPGPLTVGRG